MESIVYIGNDKQEGEKKFAEGVVTQHLWMPIAIRCDKSWGARHGRGS
jgi:hypothetical protein